MALNYTTTTNLIDRFEDDAAVAHLTDSPATGPDTVKLTELLNDAETIVDSYIARLYSVPVDVSGNAEWAIRLRNVTLDLAEVNLLRRGDLVSDAKEKQWDAAMEWLKGISSGKVAMPGGGAPGPTDAFPPGTRTSYTGTPTRVFTRDKQENL